MTCCNSCSFCIAEFNATQCGCVLAADALSSVGNSLVGAVIGGGKFSRGQEGAPLLSYEYTDHDQSAVRTFPFIARIFVHIQKLCATRHGYCILCIGNDIAFAICSDLYDIQGHLTGSKHVKLQFLVPLFIG